MIVDAIDRIFRGRRGGHERPLAAQVAALFANGEQGLWYGVEGFRDAWNNVGPELVTNGTFSNLSGWANPLSQVSVVSGRACITPTSDASASPVLSALPIALVAGKTYVLQYDVEVAGTGIVGARVAIPGMSITPTNVTSPGTVITKTTVFVASSASSSIQLVYYGAVTSSAYFDNVSVKEWVGLPMCALYQDASGTLPAYMPGQGQTDPPVGLLLDKRKALARTTVLIPNGDYASGATGWAGGSTATVAAAGGNLQLTCSGTGYGAAVNATPVAIQAGVLFLKCTASAGATIAVGDGSTYNKYGVYPASASGTWYGFVVPPTNIVLTLLTNSNTAGDVRTFSPISAYHVAGNHAYQATTASRPTLSARYNLLTSSENMAGAVWSKMGVTAGADYITESSASEGHYATQSVPTLPVGTKLRGRAEFKPRTGARNAILRFAGSNGSAYTIVDLSSGAVLLTSVTGSNWSWVEPPVVTSMGDGYYSITGFVTTTEPSGAIALWPGMTPGTSLSYLGDGVSSIYIRNTDLRAANDGIGLPPYQRVVDTNTYDTAGFPLYLRFDGVDDFLQTASLDFSGTDKVALVAAIRKLNDGAHGAVCEFSADGSANAGVFSLFAPIQALYSYRFVSKGIYSSDAGLAGFASPHSAVISGIGNISGDVSSIRVNQSSTLTSALDQGTGNYGNYPLYIGRRGGTTLPFNGRIYGLMIRAGAANDSQILKVEKYLNQKAKVF